MYTVYTDVNNSKGLYTVTKQIRIRNQSTIIRVDLASKQRLDLMANALRKKGVNITLTALASQIIMQADLPAVER